MSSFSSVVHKPGQKIKPKIAPRRKIHGTVAAAPAVLTPESLQDSSEPREDVEEAAARQDGQSHRASTSQLNAPNERVESTGRSSAQSTVTPTEDPISTRTTPPADRSGRTAADPLNTPTRIEHSSQDVLYSPRGRKRKQQSLANPEPPAVHASTTRATSPQSEAGLSTTNGLRGTKSPSVPRRHQQPPQHTPLGLPSSQTGTESLKDPQTQATHSNVPVHPSSNPFQIVAHQLESISGMVSNLGGSTRRSPALDNPDPSTSITTSGLVSTQPTSTPSSKARRKKTVQEQAAEVVANVLGDKDLVPKNRDVTPEDAENYELEPTEVTMGELTRDRRLGKKSTLEAEMQANWPEILKRRKEELEEAQRQAAKRRRGRAPPPEMPGELVEQQVVRTRLVNGRIILDEDSREVDRSGQLAQAAVQDVDTVREDKIYYKRINQATVGIKPGHSNRFRWDEDSTERFFRGLRMFGTDFLMIANMFPGVDRKQVKMKFIREENANKVKVMEHLASREEVNLDEYARETEMTLNDVDTIEREMREEEEALRKEDEERRKREGFVRNVGEDAVLPSTEAGDDNPASTEGPGRFDSEVAEILEPNETRRRQRKTTAVSKKRGPKAGRRTAETIEEALGTIDEVQV